MSFIRLARRDLMQSCVFFGRGLGRLVLSLWVWELASFADVKQDMIMRMTLASGVSGLRPFRCPGGTVVEP